MNAFDVYHTYLYLCVCVCVLLFIYTYTICLIYLQEAVSTSRLTVFGVRCIVCDHRIRGVHQQCMSCGNNYHNYCYMKAPVCSQSILQYVCCR
jgi:hypothetical protein